MSARPSVDALVVGGGPAGLAAAIEIARSGSTVAIADRPHRGPIKGETLAGAGAALLRGLGVWDALPYDARRPCYAYGAIWGAPTLTWFDGVRDPFGHGWVVHRPALVEVLRQAAAALGAALLPWQGAADYERVGSVWHVRSRGGLELSARFLIDATGRACAVARRLGACRRDWDRQIAVLAAIPGDGPSRSEPILVEAVTGGWWYSAQAPRAGLVLAFFTDRDLVDLGSVRTLSGFRALLETSTATARRAGEAGPLTCRPAVVAAQSSVLDRVCGEGWAAVGDAALAYDPLSGHGLTVAFASGRDAGRAVRASLAGDPSALAVYAERIARATEAYERRRAVQYAAERQWSEHPFWKRRSGVITCGVGAAG